MGSTEMYYAFVPSLLDAIEAGKPSVPERADGTQFLSLQRGTNTEVVQFSPLPQDVMHSFTLSFRIRCNRCIGSVATVDAEEITGSTSLKVASNDTFNIAVADKVLDYSGPPQI